MFAMRAVNFRSFILPIFLAAFFLSGCGGRVVDTSVIATVNDKPIYAKELKRELSNRVRQDPSLKIDSDVIDDLVDTLVKRQLIIQEAMDRKMPEEQSFVDTIKAFWEQTLIREFVEYKNREFERYVFVTDKEIEDYYNGLRRRSPNVPALEEIYEKLKAAIKRGKMSQALEDWLENKKKSSRIRVDKNIISQAVK
jgi:hypothetical protein